MERRTFLGTCAAMLGLPWFTPVRPIRSKPYIEEGRPEYEEPHPMLCVAHGGSPRCEAINRQYGFRCPECVLYGNLKAPKPQGVIIARSVL